MEKIWIGSLLLSISERNNEMLIIIGIEYFCNEMKTVYIFKLILSILLIFNWYNFEDIV